MSDEFVWGQSIAFSTANFTLAGGPELVLTALEDLVQHPLLRTGIGKFKWGLRHLAGLENNINEVFRDPANQAVVRADLDPKTGYHVFRIDRMPTVEHFAEDVTHQVADVAKNFHPALDQFAWQLACDLAYMGIPTDPKGVYFPIARTPAAWKNAGKTRVQIRPEHWSFIDEFQPYKGVNGRADAWIGDYVHPLTVLRELTRDDKHQVSRPVFVVPQQFDFIKFGVAPRPDGQQDWIVDGMGKPMELNLEVMRARLVGEPEPEINPIGRCIPQISFPGERQAVATLQRIARFIHIVFSEFAREFPA